MHVYITYHFVECVVILINFRNDAHKKSDQFCRFFETDYVYNEYFDGYEYYLKPTEFRENKIYRYLYVGFLKNTLTGLIPLTMLTFYYVKVIKDLCNLKLL